MAYRKGRGNVDIFGGWNPIKFITGAQVNPKYPVIIPKNERRSYMSPRRRAEGKDIVFTRKTYENIPVIGQWAANQAYGAPKESAYIETKKPTNQNYNGRTIIGPDGERMPYSNRGYGKQYRRSKYSYSKRSTQGYNGYANGSRYDQKRSRKYTRSSNNYAYRGRVQWTQGQKRYSSKQQLQF